MPKKQRVKKKKSAKDVEIERLKQFNQDLRKQVEHSNRVDNIFRRRERAFKDLIRLITTSENKEAVERMLDTISYIVLD